MSLREILYRGQIRRKGEKVQMPNGKPLPSRWVYGGIFAPHTYEKGFAVIYGNEGERDEPITGTKLEKYPVYRDTVGEYRGEDKKGQKLFDGDIVKCKHTIYCRCKTADEVQDRQMPRKAYGCHVEVNEYGEWNFVYYRNYAIEWDDWNKRVKLRNGSDYHYLTQSYVLYHDIELLGNIYDNPELLEGCER